VQALLPLSGLVGYIRGFTAMGLLDSVIGAALGGNQNVQGLAPGSGAVNADAMLQMAMQLLQQHGGIAGLANSFQQAGLGHIIASWIGTGPNLPVSGDQVTQAVGSGQLAQIAAKLGIDPAHAGNILAQLLPHVVDHLTPNGQVPAATPTGDVLTSVLGALRSRL
jgi:uncharacterized protein YidB (DUF937 family)